MKLYEISSRYEQLLDNIDSVEDEFEVNLLKQELESLQDDSEDKAVFIASSIENMKADINEIDLAIARMKERKESLQKKVAWREEYLKCHLEIMGIEKITKSPYFVIKLFNCPDSVSIMDESQIPKEYFRSKTIESLDKVKAKREMQEGVIIPGLALKNDVKLQII